MQAIKYRFLAGHYDAPARYVADVQRSMASIAQDAATQVGAMQLGVWLDPGQRGVSLRLVRDHEGVREQGIAWLPTRSFSLNEIDDAKSWIAEALQDAD